MNLEHLLKLHTNMQMGCYIDNIELSSSGKYIYSKENPDVDWSYAVIDDISTQSLEWVIKFANKLIKQPAIFSWESIGSELQTLNVSFSEEPERWMHLELDKLAVIEQPKEISSVNVRYTANPGRDFQEIFSMLYDDERINDHFKQIYIPALDRAQANNQASVIHLIAYINDVPVSCASVYIIDNYCGLYNVGTKFTFQNKGLGKWISSLALNIAQTKGAEKCFLQCEPDGFVENLYSDLGFINIATPIITTIDND